MQLVTTDGDSGTAAPELSQDTMAAAYTAYLANPLFCAAQYEELVLGDNPYRRPVRPDDITLVDFTVPVDRSNASQLSGLMGHRMLLNIHDAHRLLLPQQFTPETWRDYQLFYSETNRYAGDLIRPHLERHLFDFVRVETAEQVDGRPPASRLRELSELARRRAEELVGVAGSAAERESLTQMLAVQAVGRSIARDGQRGPLLPALAEQTAALPPTGGSPALLAFAERAELSARPHSYWQYYLPSTMALINYLGSATAQPGRSFELAGALLADAADTLAREAVLVEGLSVDLSGAELAVPPSASGLDAVADRVVAIAEATGGPAAVRQVEKGMAEYAVLLDVHHEDLMRQVRWIADMPTHHRKGERLQTAILDHKLDVDLDTFIESWEECSTTHVHDEDRLLVIESGQMEFWNCFGIRHTYKPGDMTFIPKHRLHGSVVLSGECVYHQPIITPELDAHYG